MVAPYAYYSSASDSLTHIGFMEFDSTIANCDCVASDLTGTLSLSPSTMEVVLYETIEVIADTSSVVNSVIDTATGVDQFCGDFAYKVTL